MSIEARMMPLQVLGKLAGDTAFKTKACERMLALESEGGVVQTRLRSLMTDMGTEASLWQVPDFCQPQQKMFPYILPIADLDHGLHHCMMETQLGYDEVVWSKYEKQVSALAKLFSRRDVVNRFVKFQILDHPEIEPYAKQSLSRMFDKLCPSFVKHRWKFSFEVLHWLSMRQGFFKFLQPNILKSDHDSDMTRDECDAFKQLLSDDTQAARFWAMVHSELLLHRWGFEVSEWLHACPCHSKDERKKMKQPCTWNGRRLIEVSGGKLSTFYQSLLNLRLEANQAASTSLSDLRQREPETAAKVMSGFATAKQKVALRFKQATSYLETYPWNLVNVLSFLTLPSDTVDRFKESKLFALHLVQQYDGGSLVCIEQFSRFLDATDPLGRSMRAWSSGDSPTMNVELYEELLGYATTLLCMQRLEAKHHLVSQRMSVARGSTPATVSSNLRRALNMDVRTDDFRKNLPRYMLEFERLVDMPWQSRAELARIISGYHLHIMFANVSAEQALIAQGTDERTGPHASPQCLRDQMAHIKSVLEEGSFYAMPAVVAPNGDTTYHVLQLLSMQPSLKRYMQRVLKVDDPWHQKLAVLLLGHFTVNDNSSHVTMADDDDDSLLPLAIPETEDFSFENICGGQAELDPTTFFKFDFKCVYRFDDIDYVTTFVGFSDLEVDESETALVDLKLQKHASL